MRPTIRICRIQKVFVYKLKRKQDDEHLLLVWGVFDVLVFVCVYRKCEHQALACQRCLALH